MRYIKLFESFKSDEEIRIKFRCSKYNIINFTINDDMSIDVDGDVILIAKNISKIPLKFNKVSGNFNAHIIF